MYTLQLAALFAVALAAYGAKHNTKVAPHKDLHPNAVEILAVEMKLEKAGVEPVEITFTTHLDPSVVGPLLGELGENPTVAIKTTENGTPHKMNPDFEKELTQAAHAKVTAALQKQEKQEETAAAHDTHPLKLFVVLTAKTGKAPLPVHELPLHAHLPMAAIKELHDKFKGSVEGVTIQWKVENSTKPFEKLDDALVKDFMAEVAKECAVAGAKAANTATGGSAAVPAEKQDAAAVPETKDSHAAAESQADVQEPKDSHAESQAARDGDAEDGAVDDE